MKKNNGLKLILVAIVWAVVILIFDYKLEGTEHNNLTRDILISLSMAHLFFMMGTKKRTET